MNTHRNKKGGFTLIELIVVIIILGILAAIAVPRLFRTVERSKAAGAFTAMAAIRGALERYYLKANTYVGGTFNNLDVTNPTSEPGSHFKYTIDTLGVNTYKITAERNTHEGGDGTSDIIIEFNGTDILRSGNSVFEGV